MAGAEDRLKGLYFSHKEMSRCLERCESEMCPSSSSSSSRADDVILTIPSATKKKKARDAYPRAYVGARSLVAVPRDGFEVFVSWRLFDRDGDGVFEVNRRPAGAIPWTTIAVVNTTTFVDAPDTTRARTYEYKVRAASGALAGVDSRVARVVAAETGRDYVDLGVSSAIISNALFADTDGDGEVEAVCWTRRVDKVTKERRYALTVVELFSGGETTTREFDAAMGRPTPPLDEKGWITVEGSRGKALKEAPGSESSLWSRPRAAGDVDGDGAEEIWTTAVVEGRCQYVLLKDDGVSKLSLLASVDSPYPLCDGADNSRHDAFVANLDGDPSRVSLGMMGGRHEPWRIFTLDYRNGGLVPRWDVGSGMASPDRADGGGVSNGQTSHNVAVVDVDCDGRDEIIAGATAIDDDGTILWDTNAWFGRSAHVDGVVVDDVDPRSPGFEVVLFSESGPEFGVYRAATGYPLLEGVAPGFHIQWTVAVNATGQSRGLDVVGTYGGHFVDGGFSIKTTDDAHRPYPFADWPREAHNWYPIDWDGKNGHQTVIFGFCFDKHLEDHGLTEHKPKVLGIDGRELFVVNGGGVVVRALTNALDILGDHREEIITQMSDGSIRAYLNAQPLQGPPKPTKLEDYHYRRFLAHATFPSHVVALGSACHNADDYRRDPTVRYVEPPNTLADLATDLATVRRDLQEDPAVLPARRRLLRSKAISLRREITLLRARLDLRRELANLTDNMPTPDAPVPPIEKSCSTTLFSFCFSKQTKIGKLISTTIADTKAGVP